MTGAAEGGVQVSGAGGAAAVEIGGQPLTVSDRRWAPADCGGTSPA